MGGYPLLLRHGTPEYIRSDNGPEFVAAAMQDWSVRIGVRPIRIYLGLGAQHLTQIAAKFRH